MTISQNFSDPYQPPTLQSTPPSGSGIDALKNIAFWQRFFSILGYIFTGIILLVLIAQVLIAALSPQRVPAVIGTMIGMTVGLALTVLIYFIPAMLLGGASKASKDLGEGRISLNEYAAQQKKFWRYTGMTVSIIMLIYFVIVAVAVVIGLILGNAG